MMADEPTQFPQQNNNIFFEQLVNSGFFPQSPELVLNLSTVNPGNEQKLQAPETSKSEQQSSTATQDLEKQATQDITNEQKTNINAKPADLSSNQTNNSQPTPIQQEQTRSLSTAENNIRDLDQKSKLDTKQPSASISAEPPQEQETPPVVMNNDSSTTNVKMIDPDYTQIIMQHYKNPPNWRSMIG